MIDRLLESHLKPIARGCRGWQLWRSLMYCWAALALLGLAALFAQNYTGYDSPLPFFILIIGAIASTVIVVHRHNKRPMDYRDIARQIEQNNPQLHALLLTAVEQIPASPDGELNYLQQRVIQEALDNHRQSPWGERISRRYHAALRAHWIMLVLFLVVLTGLRPHFSPGLGLSWAGASRSGGVTVTPGDVSIERGSGLVVLARFGGRLPVEAQLVINPVNGIEQRVPLAKNMADPVFGGGIPEVKGDLKYHIEYSSEQTREFKVAVFDYPKLERADAKVTYPAYTQLPEKTIKDTRRISAVEGSSLDYSFFLNKTVTSARLVARDKSTVALTPDSNNGTVYHTQIALDQNRRYELVLVDDAGRTNKLPPEFVLEALKNRPAQLRIAAPRGDQRVSALEEIAFQAEVTDDFGLGAYGLTYTLAGGETKSIELGKKTNPNEKRQFSYLLPLEDLNAQPDQLLSYYVWAEDFGPDGQVRHNESDMYFAEVKPFDEIFREGQSPDAGGQRAGQNNSGQGGQGNQGDRLSELQKQIITATWNIKRRETAPKPSSKFKDDITVVRDSQKEALDQVKAMKDQVEDPRLLTYVEAAEKAMDKAANGLGEAVDKNSLPPLTPALSDEQAAYQALLRLSSREFQVARGQRGQRGGQRGGQRAQRQLDQLDLRQTQNRYETQREANSAQTPEQRESLQVANRLKELAQRQQDLNERIRELQATMQEARTEQEREDLRARLKRLREEQQDLLADVDELSQRMDRPENQARMNEERQQLEQTRSEVQQAAEALGQQSGVSQALSSGTRAQRELQQLQDDFRRKNSSQFAEDMRRMRDDARNLAQKEDDIAKQLGEIADPRQKTLSESEEQRKQRADLASQLQQQRDTATNLFNQMRQTSEQSETAEPLLSQQLYDMVRQTDQDKLDKSLQDSAELVRRGFVPQASKQEEPARQMITELKGGVERAAESVLGDGTEALRLARRELDELTRQLDEAQAARSGQTNGDRGPGGDQQLASAQRAGGNRGNRGEQSQQGEGQGGQQSQQDSAQQANAAGNQDQQQGEGQGGQQPGRGGNRQGGQRDGQQRGGGGRGGQDAQQPGGDQQLAQANQPGEGGQQGGRGGRDANAGNRAGGRRDGGRQGGVRDGGYQNGGGGGNYWDGGNWDFWSGENYVNWSDRLRAVEEMVDVPELRTEVARIRDRARAIYLDNKKAEKKPDWAVVRTQITTPLAEVRTRVNEELMKRESKDALVPLDRDPVPSRFSELVRRYYEQLGKSDQ